jgi:hypothetical protein
LSMLSAVSLSWSTSHKKNLTFGSTKHFQIFVAGRVVYVPWNWHLYADATVNFPSPVYLQVIVSSWSVRDTKDITMNKRVKSSISVVVVMSTRLLIQLELLSSVKTDLCLNLANL